MYRVLFLILLVLPSAVFATTPTARQILAQAKAASGGGAWNSIHTLRTTATFNTSDGLAGTYNALVDVEVGRVVSHIKAGATPMIERGFDGKSGWFAVFGRAPKPASQQAAVTRAYVARYGWWYPQRVRARTRLLGSRKQNATKYWVVQITPEHGTPLDLWINAKTKLVSRIVQDFGSEKTTIDVDDYRTVHGVRIAFHRHEVSKAQGRTSVTDFHLQKVAINVPVSANDFAIPTRQ